MSCGLPWSEEFIRQLSDKEFRDEFVADRVRTRIALAIRALREQQERQWSQSELGERAGKPQSVVSRIEDPDYGKLSLQTLLEVTAAFDLPLLVEIPEWSDWLKRTAEFDAASFWRESFSADSLIAEVRDAVQAAATTVSGSQFGLFQSMAGISAQLAPIGGRLEQRTGTASDQRESRPSGIPNMNPLGKRFEPALPR